MLPHECWTAPDSVLKTVGPDYYYEGWAGPRFRIRDQMFSQGYQVTGEGEIEFMRYGSKPPFYQRDAYMDWILAPIHRYTGTQTLTVYIKRAPHLTLNCPSSVERGSSMTCTATAVGGQMTDVAWSFTDTAGNVITAPASTGSSWGGRMVVGGTMRVTAKVAGVPKDTSATITVTPRVWTLRLPDPPSETPDTSSKVTYPPAQSGKMTLGGHEYDRSEGIRGGTGPNIGWYTNAEPIFSSVRILVNGFLFPDDRYYKLQQGGSPFCTQTYLDAKRREVIDHELVHHDRANEFWQGEGGRRYEAAIQYLPNATLLTSVANVLQAPIVASLDSIQNKWDADDRRDFTCQMRT
jgi:hypothetical protein